MAGQPGPKQYQEYIRECNTAIKGGVVMASYNQRIWRVDKIHFNLKLEDKFELKSGESVTFRQYYQKQYGIAIKSNKPGLLVNIPKKLASTKQPTILIPELCHMTGYTDDMRADGRLMKALATRTRLRPSVRAGEIMSLVNKILSTEDVKKEMSAMPLQLTGKPSEVKARVLGPFDIEMRDTKHTLKDGNKNFANPVRESGFITGTAAVPEVKSWVCIHSDRDQRGAAAFADTIHFLSTRQGARMGKPRMISVSSAGPKVVNWQKAINEAKASAPSIVLYIAPGGDANVYSYVKYVCMVENAVPTQCVSSQSFRDPKMQKPIAGNVFKQMMAKLGHIPWRVNFQRQISHPCLTQPTMFVGVDVSHDRKLQSAYGPPPKQGPNSTVGFVATINPHYNQYTSYIAYQNKGDEYVRKSQELMAAALKTFHDKNKVYPANVIVYRDGVGNSQLESFVRKEIKEYELAFQKIGIKPKLSVIVVQKRSAVRFFDRCDIYGGKDYCRSGPKCDGSEPYHTPPAGTVIDTNVVNPVLSDFFLVPSIAPPGTTARPTRFIILRDDLKIGSNDLQLLTNQMCYMYYNWPGPIRVPAPCMYAHKIAYLFGKHVNGEPNPRLLGKLFYL